MIGIRSVLMIEIRSVLIVGIRSVLMVGIRSVLMECCHSIIKKYKIQNEQVDYKNRLVYRRCSGD